MFVLVHGTHCRYHKALHSGLLAACVTGWKKKKIKKKRCALKDRYAEF